MYKSVQKSKLCTFFCNYSNSLSYLYDLKQYQKYALFAIQFSLKIETSFNISKVCNRSRTYFSHYWKRWKCRIRGENLIIMKKIKPIALKDTTLLCNEEMKNIF